MGLKVEIHHLLYADLHKLSVANLSGVSSLLALDKAQKNSGYSADELLLQEARETQGLFKQLMDRSLLNNENTNKEGWERIMAAAVTLKSKGWYRHVGTLSDGNLMQAWKSTTNINGYWFLKDDIQVTSMPERQTMTLDIFRAKGTDYLLTVGGFINLATKMRVERH